MVPLDTFSQEQMVAEADSTAGPPPGPDADAGSAPGVIREAGTSGVGASPAAMAANRSNPVASPTRTPPVIRPSSLITSRLWTNATSSLKVMVAAPGARAWASPKLATSTPNNFSLVGVSPPSKVASPPQTVSATTRAIW